MCGRKTSKKTISIAQNNHERKALRKYIGKEISIIADFDCFSYTKAGLVEQTIALKNIRLSNDQYICHHIWIKSKDVQNFIRFVSKLKRGCEVHMVGQAYAYYSEYRGKIRSIKYSLNQLNFKEIFDPTQIIMPSAA